MSYRILGHPVRRAGGRPALALSAITVGIGGLGGAGLGRSLVHLFIWRLIWRGGLAIWRVPVFGPVIDVVLAVVVVILLMLRSQLGLGWWRRAGRRPWGRGSSSGGPPGSSRGDEAGPRDW